MPVGLPYPPGASDEALKIQSLIQMMNARPAAPSPLDAVADQFQALGQQWMNDSVPPMPLPSLPIPQSALTQDRELRHFGAEPAPPSPPADLLANQMNVAIPNLEAQGYRNIGPMRPPEGVPSIGTPEGFMTPPSNRQPGRDINELRMLDAQNKAAAPGMMDTLTNWLTGTPQPEQQNLLSTREQMMVDALKADQAQRDATMAERQKLVTQHAQMKQMGRDIRQEGPDVVMFNQMSQALQGGGGEVGPPDPRLALLAPKVFAAQMEAWEAGQNQQRLDQRDEQLNLDREEGRRRFDVTRADAATREANQERRFNREMDFNERKADPFGLNQPTGTPTAPTNADFNARKDAHDTALGVNVVERDKNAGVYSEHVRKALEEQYRVTHRRDLNPMTAFSPDRQHFDNQHFIQEMMKQGWQRHVIDQFLNATGRAVPAPNYPAPPTRSERQVARESTGGGSWLFPGF